MQFSAMTGVFETIYAELLKSQGFAIPYVDQWDEGERTKKAASKTKYTCPICNLNTRY